MGYIWAIWAIYMGYIWTLYIYPIALLSSYPAISKTMAPNMDPDYLKHALAKLDIYSSIDMQHKWDTLSYAARRKCAIKGIYGAAQIDWHTSWLAYIKALKNHLKMLGERPKYSHDTAIAGTYNRFHKGLHEKEPWLVGALEKVELL